ncbi:MAG TPA: DUF3053 family protein [Acetobacteraceae bacterium]|nr:DUF3053 family protein [Acetobacteraceae bacterium]
MLHRRSTLAGAFALLLAGCDDEPAQRNAFAEYLQKRILDRQGVHVPRPTAEETKSWGDYAKHYAIIVEFNDALTERVSKPMQQAVQRGGITSIQGMVDRRADLAAMQRGMAELAAELDRQLAKADAARAALPLPADLKPVYDAAYARDVTGPAVAFKEVFPAVNESLAAAIALADLLAQNRARIRVNGAMVETADAALQRDVQARLTALNGTAQQVQSAQRRLQSLITGS